MEIVFNWNDYSIKQDELFITVYLDGDTLFCCEYTDNPHDYQSEIKCSIEDFLLGEKEEAMKCKRFIIEYFGVNELEKIFKILKDEKA